MSEPMTRPAPDVMRRLADVSAGQGLSSLADTLALLGAFVASDLEGLERELDTVPRREHVVGQSGRHLLSLGGKRIRPLCVALASRMGEADPYVVRKLGCAAELVHSATLLHDDVVDHSEMRRGKPTAWTLYGNAASVFAGDWLLIEAIRRVRVAGVPGLLDRLLDVIDEMITGEALQLDRRGRIQADAESYFEVIEGKTAALFRWALFAGGRAAGLGDDACVALERYGYHLGVAFQIVDDALDLAGDPSDTGKALFTDLKEGKMTYPLIVGLQRDPSMKEPLHRAVLGSEEIDVSMAKELLERLRATGAIEEAHQKALEHADHAIACLDSLPDTMARGALAGVARIAVERRA